MTLKSKNIFQSRKSQTILLAIVLMGIVLFMTILLYNTRAENPPINITYSETTETTCNNGVCNLIKYSVPKYYFYNGDYYSINLTLIPSTRQGYDFELDDEFHNYKNSKYNVFIRNNSNTAGAVRFEKDGYFFTYDLSDGQMIWKGTPTQPDAWNTLGGGCLSNSQGTQVKITGSRAEYPNTFCNTNVTYELRGDMLKETFVLYGLPSYKDYLYLQYSGNVKFNSSLKICANGTCYPDNANNDFETEGRIDFQDTNNNTIFYLKEPIITDSNGSQITGIYKVHGSNAQMNFYLKINKTWLQNATYPVFIDPTIKLVGANLTADLGMSASGPPGKEHRTFQMKWSLLSIPASQTIDSSLLCMWISSVADTPDTDVTVHYVNNESWVEYTSPPTPYKDLGPFLNQTNTTHSSITAGQWDCIDVTTQVQQSYANGNSNMTLKIYDRDFLFTGTDPDRVGNIATISLGNNDVPAITITFNSSEALGATPYLNVTYSTVSDTIDPVISIIYPTNTSYNINISTFNYTVDDETAESSCWYSRNRGVTNSTAVTAGINWSNVVSIEGSNNYTVFCNDTSNNIAGTTLYFFKDTVKPQISIIYPTNTSYGINISNLNFTVGDTNLQVCKWSRDGWATNTSITCGNNVSNMVSVGGNNTYLVWVNDTSGNTNSSSITFDKDSVFPQISIIYPTNTTYNINISNLNYTYTDTYPDSCWYSRDLGITNSTSVAAGINFSNVVSVFGNNTYTLYCNDTTSNLNTTSITFTSNALSGCQKITQPGSYVMIGDILNSATSYCINISAQNVTFNCQRKIIDGNDIADYGIWIEANPAQTTNITITNCSLNDWDTEAIHVTRAHGNNFSNINVTSSPDWGIYLRSSNFSIFENVTISNALDDGIYLLYSYYNNLTNINSTDNSLYGIRISTGSYNLIKDSSSLRGTGGVYLTTNSDFNNLVNLSITLGSYGVYLATTTSQNNTLVNSTISRSTTRGIYISSSQTNNIYNNLFNNTVNFGFVGTNRNDWNTTTIVATNIVGGAKVAGNFWATPAGTGFSQTPSLCQDTDGDGVCNNRYTLNANNIDYSPLSDITSADTAPPKVYFTAYPVGKINGQTILFSGYLQDETMGKNLTLIVYNGTTSNAVLAVNTTSSLRIYLTNYFNSSNYATGTNLTFKFLAYDLIGNSNQTNITLTVDHNVPILSANPVLNPWITPSKTYYKNNDIITLRINATDGSGAGMNYVQINPKNINGTNQYINMTLESGNKGTGNYSTTNFTITINNETGLNKPIDFYLVDAAVPISNDLNYTFTYNLDNNAPTYSSLTSSTPITNNTAGTFSVTGIDNYELGSYIFAQNSTGTWVNSSPVIISGSSYEISTIFTPTIIGEFNYYFIINDSAGNQNTTALGTSEVTEPTDIVVYLHYPSNNASLSTSEIQLNWSYEMGVAVNCSIYIDDAFNQTSSAYPSNYTTYNFTVNFAEGNYHWQMDCIQNETNEIFVSEIWEFTIDTTFPTLSIIYPTNISYNTNVSNLNYTYIDTNPASCWYSRDLGITNSTSLLANINFTTITSIEGSNNWTLFCNDTSNNINSTWLYFWKDTIAPLCTIISPNNSVYLNATMYFNITSNEEISKSVYSFNNWTNNYTLSSFNLSYYYAVNTSMQEGIQTVKFWCNDTSGNANTSVITFGGLDTIHPEIVILSPSNTSYFIDYSINLTLNVSVNYSDITGYWWSYNEGKNNYTFTPNTTMSWDQPARTTYVYNITVWVNDTHNNVAFNISQITFESTNPGDIIPGGGGTGGGVSNKTTEIINYYENKTVSNITMSQLTEDIMVYIKWLGSMISPSNPIKIGIPIILMGIGTMVFFYLERKKKQRIKNKQTIRVVVNNPHRKRGQR